MLRRATLRLVLALAAAAVPAFASAQTLPSPDPVLVRYKSALGRLPQIANIVFQYSESRSGPTRALEEEHRVYRRSDGEERNETIGVNGAAVVPAIVRYATKPVWPYDVRAFVVDPADYNVLATGRTIVTGKRAYGYSTVRVAPTDFSVTGLYLDVVRYLPLRMTFEVTGGGCSGKGSIDFGPVGVQWLPTSANVSCSVAQGAGTFKESVTFTDYAFPVTLPPDVFEAAPATPNP